MPYPIPKKQANAEIEIKKSRFIGHAKRVQSRVEAMDWLAKLKQ